MTPKQIDKKIRDIVRKISKKTKDSNKDHQAPLVMSENDLCCQIFHKLYPYLKGYKLITELKADKSKPDISIAPKGDWDDAWELNKNGNWKDKQVTKSRDNRDNPYTALLELKVQYSSKKTAKKYIKNDLKKLKNEKSKYKYLVYFDFKSNFNEKEINDDYTIQAKKSKIEFIYVPLNPIKRKNNNHANPN